MRCMGRAMCHPRGPQRRDGWSARTLLRPGRCCGGLGTVRLPQWGKGQHPRPRRASVAPPPSAPGPIGASSVPGSGDRYDQVKQRAEVILRSYSTIENAPTPFTRRGKLRLDLRIGPTCHGHARPECESRHGQYQAAHRTASVCRSSDIYPERLPSDHTDAGLANGSDQPSSPAICIYIQHCPQACMRVAVCAERSG